MVYKAQLQQPVDGFDVDSLNVFFSLHFTRDVELLLSVLSDTAYCATRTTMHRLPFSRVGIQQLGGLLPSLITHSSYVNCLVQYGNFQTINSFHSSLSYVDDIHSQLT